MAKPTPRTDRRAPVGFGAAPRSLPDFARAFPDAPSCYAYLYAHKYPTGFACPHCAAPEAAAGPPYRFTTHPTMIRCRACRRNTHLAAGTIMEKSKVPICTWFWAAYLATNGPVGLSAMQLQRELGINRYETAYMLLQKLRAAMFRPQRAAIGATCPVEVDEKWVEGTSKGSGKGVHHKTLVCAAVEVLPREAIPFSGADPNATIGQATTPKHPRHGAAVPGQRRKTTPKSDKGGHGRGIVAGRLRMAVVADRKAASLVPFVQVAVAPGAVVRTDGWQGYNPLDTLGYRQERIVVGGDQSVTDAHLPMIHIVFGNLDAWLLGTHHGVSPKHLQAYLNEFTFRFNRRFWPTAAFDAVLGIAAAAAGAWGTDRPTYAGIYSGAWEHPGSGGGAGEAAK